MAHYTITIKTLLDNHFDFKMTDYPIFDEAYRDTLNQNILYHYYENEIGFETAPLFRFYLNQKLREIMPKYNILYQAQQKLIDENTLYDNVKLAETLEASSSGTGTSSNSGTSGNSSKQLYQDTPQGRIGKTAFEDQEWATNLSMSESNGTDSSQSNQTTSGTNQYVKTIAGKNGGKLNIEVLEEIKNNIMNIDLMVIDELQELFMGIY